MVRLVKKEYKVKKQEKKRPCNQRIRVRIITKEKLDEIKDTEIFKAIQKAKMNLGSVHAIHYHQITPETHEAMAYFRDNGDMKEGWEIIVIVEDSYHGAIPLKDGYHEVDIVTMMQNRKHENLRLHGSMKHENQTIYKHATILNQPFYEDELITVDLPVQVGGSKKKPKIHQFLYATCHAILASFLFWKDITHLFEVVTYYLVMPNLNWLLIRKDTNEYVRKQRKDSGYKPWNKKVNLPDEKIEEFLKSKTTLGINPLYKMVSVEEIDEKMVIFFVPLTGKEFLRSDGTYSWAMYQVANVYKKYKKGTTMCIAALAAVCDDGIAPVKIQKDPPIQLSFKKEKHYGGSVQFSLSNHKHATKEMNSNCLYRVGDTDDDDETEGPLQFPGNIGVPEKDVVLMKEVNDSAVVLQNACTRAFEAGKGNLVEDVLSKLNIAIEDINDGLVTTLK